MLSRRIDEWRTLTDRDLLRAQAALRAIAGARRAEFRRASEQLPKCARAALARKRQQYEAARGRVSLRPLLRAGQSARERLGLAARRHEQGISVALDRSRTRLTQADRLLSTLKLSEQAILERGYALVLDAAGTLVKRAADIRSGETLELRFADGAASAIATDGAAAKPAAKAASKPRAAGPKAPGDQGSLF